MQETIIITNSVPASNNVQPQIVRRGRVDHLLNMRARPNCDSDILTVLEEDSIVVILSDRDELFYKVKYDGVEGYCMKDYISEV